MLWLFHSLLHLELLQHVTECNGMTLRLCPMAFLVLSVSSTGSKVNIDTLSLFYKQWFISNDFETSQFLKKIKQQTSLFLKN